MPASPRRPSQSQSARPSSPPESQPEAEASRTGSPGSSSSPLGLVGDAFRKPEGEAPPAARLRDLEEPDYEPPLPDPVEWDADKMELALRGLGGLLHAIDPVGDSPYAPELWRMTEDDLEAISEPAARIANRYATMRGLAGYSDEVGLGLAMTPYVKRNLALRGRVKARHKIDERQGEHATRYEPEPAPAPATAAAPPPQGTVDAPLLVDDEGTPLAPHPPAGDVFDVPLTVDMARPPMLDPEGE